MPQPDDRERTPNSLAPVHDAPEDMEEHIHRMADEGGGVVDQNFPVGAPIARNSLLVTEETDGEGTAGA